MTKQQNPYIEGQKFALRILLGEMESGNWSDEKCQKYRYNWWGACDLIRDRLKELEARR